MKKTEKFIQKLGFSRIKLDEPLKFYTWIKVGGPADYFFEAENEEDIVLAVKTSIKADIPYTIIGLGANVLFSDKGFRGLVIVNKAKNIKFLPHNHVEVESGVNVMDLAREAGGRGLGGLERMTKVPATVGGAVFMNAGDTGISEFFEDLIIFVKVIDQDGVVKKIYPEDLNFSYRTSRFQKSSEIILSARLELKKMTKEEIDEKVRDILVRKTHHPAGPSVGSTFRNPEGEHAGSLIDKCNLKGKNIGGAKISEQHANFIINTGNAKADDVKSLIDLMKSSVKDKFNIDLVEEVRYLGEW